MRGKAVFPAVAAVLLVMLNVRSPAQVSTVAAIEGEWIRVDSTYQPNDTMRISIGQGQATILRAPASATFKAGQRLWMSIRPDGSLQVLGSDSNYYPGQMKLDGTDLIHLTVMRSARGDTQIWRRAGPAIDGEWVRVAVGNRPGDRMRIAIVPGEASIRFLPSGAARNLRVGSRYWQDIRAAGTLEVIGADGQYRLVKYTVNAERQQLCVAADDPRGEELWVRPGSEKEALAFIAGQPEGAKSCLPTPVTPADVAPL